MGRSVSTPQGAFLVAYDHIDYEDEYDDWSFSDFVDDVIYRAKRRWPSLTEDDGWAGREDRVLMSNGLVQLGVSEYCGLVAVWMRALPDLESEALAERWMNQIAGDFDVEYARLRRLGVMSNGGAVFERMSA